MRFKSATMPNVPAASPPPLNERSTPVPLALEVSRVTKCYGSFKAVDDLTFALLKGMPRSKARQRAYELLTRYGLKDACDKPVDALSKGMAQKVQMLASI